MIGDSHKIEKSVASWSSRASQAFSGQNDLPAAVHVTMDGDGQVAFYFEADARLRSLEFTGDGMVHTSERREFGWDYLGETPIREQAAQSASIPRKAPRPKGDRMKIGLRD